MASLALGASFEIPVPTRPLFVARAGGKKLFGDFPFYEAAMLGGHETTQYINSQRYAGDGSLYGTSELYVPLTRFTFLIPVRAGVTGVAESGRVYYKGSSPDGWHSTTGGGIWIGRVLRVRDAQHRSNDWRAAAGFSSGWDSASEIDATRTAVDRDHADDGGTDIGMITFDRWQ